MEITGKVVKLGAYIEGTSARGPWRKQELIIETDEQFPRTVCLLCWTNQVDEAKAMQPGQMVRAQITVESREFNNKWYTDVRAWRFDPYTPGVTNQTGMPGQMPGQMPQASYTPQAAHQQPQPQQQTAQPADYFTPAGNADDLPF